MQATSPPVELAAVVDLGARRSTSLTGGSEPQGGNSGAEPAAAEIPTTDVPTTDVPTTEIPTAEAGDEAADRALLSEAFLELTAAQQATLPRQPAQAPAAAAADIPNDAPPTGDCLPVADEEDPAAGDELTDRSSLMRELSSLGAEDAQNQLTPPPRAPIQQPAVRQQSKSAPQRKRKGLFSRG